MAFPDFPFPRQEKSFLHHTEVLDYLELYTDTHNLRRLIQFTTQVERVAPSKGGWEVTTRHLPTGETSTASYGAVMAGVYRALLRACDPGHPRPGAARGQGPTQPPLQDPPAVRRGEGARPGRRRQRHRHRRGGGRAGRDRLPGPQQPAPHRQAARQRGAGGRGGRVPGARRAPPQGRLQGMAG